jgi:hypothetical protein
VILMSLVSSTSFATPSASATATLLRFGSRFRDYSLLSLASDAYPPDEHPCDVADNRRIEMEIFERIRYARDRALEREQTERQRLAEADTPELQQAASVRLATRQSVREALDDILDESSEGQLEKGS